MQALLLNSLGQGEEAFALAKVALRNDMKSHVCWHVYGLLWRSVKNFDEAIKAYRFALRLEPTSAQILRDLALLQAQMRDTAGYLASRAQMLQERPQVRQHWTAVAVAHHMAGDLRAAEKVLRAYEDTLKTPPPRTDVEHAEAVLYRNTLIAEMGETERALLHLDEVADRQLDRTAVMEMRAGYLLQLGRKDEAERAYRALIERNSEYRAYYEGLEKSLGLDRSMQKELKELYGEYAQKFDRLDAARRIPLDFLDGKNAHTSATFNSTESHWSIHRERLQGCRRSLSAADVAERRALYFQQRQGIIHRQGEAGHNRRARRVLLCREADER